MIRQGAKIITSQSRSIVTSLKPYSPISNYSFNRFKNTHFKFSSSSGHIQDDLIGLSDPDFFNLGNLGDTAGNHRRDESVLAEDFAFLNDTVLDYDNSVLISSEHSSKYSNEAVLIVDTIRANDDGFGDKTHRFLRQFRGRLNDSLVIDVLKIVKNPELGVRFFIWAGRQIGFHHSGSTYHSGSTILGRAPIYFCL